MRRIIGTLILVSVIDLALLGGLWYGFSSMQGMKSGVKQLGSKIAAEEQKSKRLAEQERMLASAESAKARMSRFFYTQDEASQIRFVSEIESLGRMVPDLSLETKSFDYVASAKNVTPIFRLTLEISGSWTSLFHFLRLLEEFPARLVVERFESKHKQDTKAWGGTMVVSLISLSAAN